MKAHGPTPKQQRDAARVVEILKERGYNVNEVMAAVNRPAIFQTPGRPFFGKDLVRIFWGIVHEVNPHVKPAYH